LEGRVKYFWNKKGGGCLWEGGPTVVPKNRSKGTEKREKNKGVNTQGKENCFLFGHERKAGQGKQPPKKKGWDLFLPTYGEGTRRS